MGQFNRDRRPSNNRNFSSGGRYNDRSERAQMYPATCANCGKACEVPFRPTGDKPVLCRDCFRSSGNGPDRRSGGGQPNRSFDKPRFEERSAPAPQYKEQLNELNYKLDKILNILTSVTQEVADQEMEEEVVPVVEEVVAEEAPAPKKKKSSKKK